MKVLSRTFNHLIKRKSSFRELIEVELVSPALEHNEVYFVELIRGDASLPAKFSKDFEFRIQGVVKVAVKLIAFVGIDFS